MIENLRKRGSTVFHVPRRTLNRCLASYHARRRETVLHPLCCGNCGRDRYHFWFKFLISQGFRHLKSCRHVFGLDNAREKSKLEAPYCHSESQTIKCDNWNFQEIEGLQVTSRELQGTSWSWNVRRWPDVSGRRVLLHRMAGSWVKISMRHHLAILNSVTLKVVFRNFDIPMRVSWALCMSPS